MKIWRTTYSEFEKRFGGLRRLVINRKDGNLAHYGTSIVPVRYRVNICYIPKKGCTYIGLTCLGYLDVFEPMDNDLTIAIRLSGNVTAEELVDKDFAYKDGLAAIMGELEKEVRFFYRIRKRK